MTVNHVPDDALAAIDRFGEGLLVGAANPVNARLRSDLRLVVPCTVAAIEAGRTTARFRMAHTRNEPTLREYGSFIGTIADGVDDQFLSWGIDPPDAYAFGGERDGRLVYEGELRLP
jgi:hypothetical protein